VLLAMLVNRYKRFSENRSYHGTQAIAERTVDVVRQEIFMIRQIVDLLMKAVHAETLP